MSTVKGFKSTINIRLCQLKSIHIHFQHQPYLVPSHDWLNKLTFHDINQSEMILEGRQY